MNKPLNLVRHIDYDGTPRKNIVLPIFYDEDKAKATFEELMTKGYAASMETAVPLGRWRITITGDAADAPTHHRSFPLPKRYEDIIGEIKTDMDSLSAAGWSAQYWFPVDGAPVQIAIAGRTRL